MPRVYPLSPPHNSHSFNPSSSQYCRPISTQSITSTDSGDSEENYVPMVSPPALPSSLTPPAPGQCAATRLSVCLSVWSTYVSVTVGSSAEARKTQSLPSAGRGGLRLSDCDPGSVVSALGGGVIGVHLQDGRPQQGGEGEALGQRWPWMGTRGVTVINSV